MRLLKYMLPLLALLIWSAAVSADYDPTSPPEPGVNFTLTTRCIPEKAAYSITPSATHSAESNVRMEVSGNTGFRFVQWEDVNGNVVSTERIFTYIMPAQDATLIARFEFSPNDPEEPGTPEFKEYAKIYFGVFPTGAGSFYSGGSYNPSMESLEVGTTRRLAASAHRDYKFINWTADGEVISDQEECEYTIPSGEHTIVANFEYDPSNPEEPGEQHFLRTLTVKCNPEGAGSPYGSGQINDGERKNVYTTVNAYYTFVNWTDDLGEVVSEERDFYYTMPNRNVTLTANFTYNYDPANPGEPIDPTPPGSIAENMVAYPRFGMYDDTHVMILCETEDAIIHYTLDGSDPTPDSPVYTEPVFVPGNILVKAIGLKEGMDDSPIRSYQVTTYHVAAPIFTFVNRKIEITSDTPDAVIRYTLDFSEPNADSEVFRTPFEPEENCRIKAYASKEGLTDSKVSVFVYRRADYTMAAPTFSLNEEGKLVITPAVDGATNYYTLDGSEPTAESTLYDGPITLDGNGTIKAYSTHINYFDSPVGEYVATGFVVARPTFVLNNPLLSIQSATQNAQIRYTLDGSVPNEESTLYGSPIRLSEDCKVIARGYKANYEPSDTISFNYIYRDYMLPTPTAAFANKVLTLTCSDSEAQIRYTLDGSSPGVTSTLYEAPIALTEDCTVKFIATREGFNNSSEGSFEFVRSYYTVATPVLTYDRDSTTATATTATEDAVIRYTIDGTIPESNSGNLYSAPIPINGNQTLTVRAFKEGFFDSDVATLSVDDQKVPTPTASFANKLLTLSCPDRQAQIHYTLDGSEPTASSSLYENPISLTADCTVKFIATREGFNNSDVAQFEFAYANYRVATPTFDYNSTSKTVTIACATANATIRYTLDGTDPSVASRVYDTPVAVSGNVTIKARGYRDDLFDSNVATLTTSDRVATPTANFVNKQLTLTCPDSEAQIHYTTDGSIPSGSSTLYEGPITLTTNCTVRFIAVRPNYSDSEIGVFEFVITRYTVAAPTITYNSDDATVTIECETAEAQIRYTTDGSEPTATSGTVYTTPITVENNMTVMARAFKADMFDSEVSTYRVGDRQVPTPTASYAEHAVTLVCEDAEAQIRYTIDGSIPTASSPLYTSPIDVAADCLIRFIAIRPNFNNSDEESFEFTLSDYQEEKAVITKDFHSRKITVSHPNSLEVNVTLGQQTTRYQTPITLDVTSDMGRVAVIALATNPDRYDSETTNENLVFHNAPVISFNGHTITVATDPADPNGGDAQRNVSFNDIPYSNKENVTFDVDTFGVVTAFVESDAAFYSATSTLNIDFFNTGDVAGARNGHRLSEAFGKWENSETKYVNLTIKGEIETQDLAFVATLPELTTLTLEPDKLTAEDYDSVLAPSVIETIVLSQAPEGIFKGISRLTSIVWTGSTPMPDNSFSEIVNPNLLLWVDEKALAPSEAGNIVTRDFAENIHLTPGYPFNPYKAFIAGHIELTKEFTQPTEVDVCRGWETIALPFSPQTIIHESKGTILPFAEWDGEDSSPKPFWLYQADPADWIPSNSIEAGVPYLISMPNNAEYIEAFNLNGNVTFSADDVTIGPEESMPLTSDWVNGMKFEATFMPIEGEILSLNVNATDSEDLPGSKFIQEAKTLPFGAYVTNTAGRKKVAVFGDWSGITLPTLTRSDVLVETLGHHKVRISSTHAFTAEIYTLTGMKVRSVYVSPGESVLIDDLAKGIYIVAGSKISIN